MQTEERIDRLSDKFIDDLIDQDTYNKKKEQLLHEVAEIKEQIQLLNVDREGESEVYLRNFELLKSLATTYSLGDTGKKQGLLDIVTSNYWTFLKTLEITLKSPFYEVAREKGVLNGGPYRANSRTDVAKLNKRLSVVFTKSRGKNKKDKD